MRQRMIRVVPGVFIGLLAAVALTILPTSGVPAANDCLAAPASKTTPGGHWYYRTERGSNRRCWFLAEPGSRTPRAEAPRVQASADATAKPTLSRFLSWLAAPFRDPAGTQQDRAKGDAPVKQAVHRNAPGNNDGETRTRVANRLDATGALGRKQPRDEQQPAPVRNQAEQDALFQEFLRWKQRQTP